MPTPNRWGIKQSFCLTSVAYIRPGLSREQRGLGILKLAEVAHVTRDSDTTFKVKVQGHQAALVGCSSHYMIYMDDTIIITRASRCLPIMNIHGSKRAGCRTLKACRLWTGGGPQRAYSRRGGGILSPCAQLLYCTSDDLKALCLKWPIMLNVVLYIAGHAYDCVDSSIDPLKSSDSLSPNVEK